ncbi:MAG TPA: DUF58 domain-containing protein [Methanomassiliicoccales archaeon]|nr:DUF58 domain-containing protein [Methanomassiliicoccales archaeon]
MGAAFALFFAGLVTRRWEFFALTLTLILFPYVAFLTRPTGRNDLRVERSLASEQIMEDDELEVRLKVVNEGAPLKGALFIDHLPTGAELLSGRSSFALSLDRGETAEIGYKVRFARRGRYEFTTVDVQAVDPSLLFRRRIEAKCPATLRVLPLVEELRRPKVAPRKVRMDAGNVPSKLLGQGYEFYSMREYTPGDEIRRVNWKATARSDRVLTNELLTERSGDVVIVVDGRWDRPGAGKRSLLDVEVDAAASLASHLLKERNRVGMVLLGETVDVVRLAYGKKQFYRITDALVQLRPGGTKSTLGIRRAVDRYFSSKALVVVISPLDDQNISNVLQELSRKGREVLVISPSTLEIQSRLAGDDEAARLALAISRIERQDTLVELRRHCTTIDWSTDAPLSKSLMGVGRLLRRTV